MAPLLALARVAVIRFLRERSNLFFVFVFPILIVLLVGATFGDGVGRPLVIVDEGTSSLAEDLHAALDDVPEVDVRRGERDEALQAVAAGTVAAVILVPQAADQATADDPVTIEYVARSGTGGPELRAIVQAELDRLGRASRAVAGLVGVGVDPSLAAQAVADAPSPEIDVPVEIAAGGDAPSFEGLGQFDLGAAQQLVLFTFLAALAGSAGLIQIREWGIAQRLRAMPVTSRQVLAGLALGRWTMALFQAFYIMVGTTLIFGVRWGPLVPALVLVSLFAAVSAAAGLLMGAQLRNQAQANGVAVFVGLSLAALGGCMLPLEIMPETLRTLAHVTPHAWALDGFAEVVRRDGSVADILPELGALVGYLVVLLSVGGWRLRVSLSR